VSICLLMVRLCHFRSPVGRKPHRKQRLYSLSKLSDKVFEEADGEGDGPVSGVEALEELEGLLRFIAERRKSSGIILLLRKSVNASYVQVVCV
jgi:hypothetical protein